MAETDEVIRLVLQTKGQEAIDALRRSTAAYKDQLESTTVAFTKGEITAEEFERSQKRLGAEYERQLALLKRLEAEMGGVGSAVGKVGEKTDAATGKTAALGRSAIETGRVVQDFYQGGFAGVLNNIEGLFGSLGKAVGLSAGAISGLAGAATIAGVALYAFGPSIMEALRGLGLFGAEAGKAHDALGRLKERIESLEKKGIEIGVDVTQLETARREVERIEKALGAAERLRNKQGDWEQASGKQVADVLSDDPNTLATARSRLVDEAVEIDGKIAETRARSARARERIQEMERQAQEQGGIENVGTEYETGPRAEYDFLRNQVDSLAREAAARRAEIARRGGVVDQVLDPLVQAAQEGRGEAQARARNQLAGLLDRSGQGEIAGQVRAASPEAIEREDAEQEAFDAAIARRQEAIKRRDAAVARAKKRDDEARKQADKVKALEADAGRARKAALDANRQRDLEDQRGFEAVVAEQVKEISGGGLDKQAAAAAAQYRFNQGIQDRFGRFKPLGPEQQTAALTQDLSGIIGRTNPEMAITTRDAVAAKMAEDAMARADMEAAGRRPFAPDERSAQYAAMASLQTEADRAAMDRAKGWAAGGGPGMSGMPGMAPTPSTAPTPTRAQAGAAMAADQAQAVMDAFDAYGQAAAASQDAGSSATAATQAAMAKALDALQGALGRIERLEDQARQLDQMADGLTARARSPQRRGR